MRNYLKLLTIIVIAFVMMISINVKADENYELYSNSAGINITIPIHKTDSNKKPLEGAIFTLKDFNNTISYSSSYEGDGDYLIDVYKFSSIDRREDNDQEYRIEDYYSDDETLTEILDIIPSRYSDVIRKAQNREDLYDLLDLPLSYSNSYDDGYYVGFFVPLKVEESKVPAGYKAKNIVIPASVSLGFNDYLGDDEGSIRIYLSYGPGSFGDEGIPAYFEYKESSDYEAIFDDLNTKISKLTDDTYIDFYDKVFKLFEDSGAIVDKECKIQEPPRQAVQREDIEERFSDDITDRLCPINLVDEKEDVIVNPETAGTIGIVTLLLVISSIIFINTKKIKNN